MRGPIDYIIVGFEGNKFNGEIFKALEEVIEKGIIGLVALAVITKDKNGGLNKVDIAESGDGYAAEFSTKYKPDDGAIGEDDLEEVADLLENDTSAGLLVIEQLWALPLKKALMDANGVLVAEGRIHPDAAEELNKKG